MTRLALAAILLLPGCGFAASLLRDGTPTQVYVVLVDEIPGRAWARTRVGADETWVFLERKIPDFLLWEVVAHELFHAQGMEGHPFVGSTCISAEVRQHGRSPPFLCAAEVEWLEREGRRKAVHAVSWELEDAVSMACAVLNWAVGSEMFVPA